MFGGPARGPEEPFTQRHMDLAASVQAGLGRGRPAHDCFAGVGDRDTQPVMAGGVGLNGVANGKILRAGKFEKIWIQPAAGDAGGAVGSALSAYHKHKVGARRLNGSLDGMKGAYLGPSFDRGEIERRLTAAGAKFTVYSDTELLRAHRRCAGRRQSRRLVSGPHGVRSARLG